MSSNNTIPSAWDDDFPAVADSTPNEQPAPARAPQRISRAERKAQHQQANKQLWESAENPEPFHYVELRNGDVPINADLKPTVKVLSRKPVKPSGLENGTQALALDDDGDSEEEERRQQERKRKERTEQAARDRVEKQRKYEEARARIMGSATPTTDNASSGRNSPAVRTAGRARGRGDRRGGQTGSGGKGSQDTSSADQSPSRAAGQQRQLYDPSDTGRPGSGYRRQLIPASVVAGQPVRQPRGPDGSGRGGFGFAVGEGSINEP